MQKGHRSHNNSMGPSLIHDVGWKSGATKDEKRLTKWTIKIERVFQEEGERCIKVRYERLRIS